MAKRSMSEESLKISFDQFLDEHNFKLALAGLRHHGAYAGGLKDHCDAVYQELLKVAALKPGLLTEFQCYCLAYGHDLVKTECYVLNEDGTYSYDKSVVGHGAKSLEILKQWEYFDLVFTAEMQAAVLFHMGYWTYDQGSEGLIEKLREAFSSEVVKALSIADMLAANFLGK